jgi:hypothetical protein
MVCQFLNGMVCHPVTSEAGARPVEGQLSPMNDWEQFHLKKPLVMKK